MRVSKNHPNKKSDNLRRLKFSKTRMAVFALLFGALSVFFIIHSFAAATTYYLSPNGSDSNPCSQTQPCQNFQRAYNLASPGDTVIVGSGTYGSQSINYDASKVNATSRVTFQAAASNMPVLDNSPSFDGLGLHGAQHLEFVGLDIRGDACGTALNRSDPSSPRITDVVIRDGKLQTFHCVAVVNVTIKNNEIGNYNYADGFGSNSVYSDSQGPSTNFTLEGNTIHNIVCAGSCHAECLFIKSVDTVNIRNNKMQGCPGLAIALYDVGATGAKNITIENNFLDCATNQPLNGCYAGGYTIEMATKGQGPISNVIVRYNTMSAFGAPGSMIVDDQASFSGTNLSYGNIAASNCEVGGGWQTNYNLVSTANSACPTNRVASPGWVSPGSYDFHLANSSPAIDLVPTTFCSTNPCPTNDIDNTARPSGAGFDAGADELDGGTSSTPTLSLTANPTSISSGSTSTLSWSSTNTTSCSASGAWTGSKATSGTQSVSPTTTSTYDLTCTGTGGSANASATITVTTGGGGGNTGDLNNDGTVNITGLSILLSNYSSTNATADINKDGTVNILDLSILLSNYGA
jgi:hypothetical protein